MFIKSLTVAAVAVIAAVSAQTPPAVPNHTYFTAPVGNSAPFIAGKNSTFSWTATCAPPSDMVAADPTKAVVQLVNAEDGNNAAFLVDITTIDCTKPSGNTYWTPPGDWPNITKFALRIVLPTPQYSGNFAIQSATPPATSSTPSPTPSAKSAGSMVTPVLAGAATIASAALLFL